MERKVKVFMTIMKRAWHTVIAVMAWATVLVIVRVKVEVVK